MKRRFKKWSGSCRNLQAIIERKGRCDSIETDEPCPICRGEVSDEFVAMIEKAAAQPGRAMTIGEFEAWVDGL